MFERLKARLEQLLHSAARPDPRADAIALRTALIEAKAAACALQAALAESEQELAAERQELANAERRGRLAAEVPDPETVAVAERFAVRHRGRIALLERKLAVQRDEVVLINREVEELAVRYRLARAGGSSDSIDAAWRDLATAGVDRSELDPAAESLAAETDQQLRDRAVEAQLAYLKRKMGKNPITPP